MPRLRELTLRPRRLGGLKFSGLNFKPKKNQEAALGQICGDLALSACLRCIKGRGPFVECVIVQGYFAKSCCNCHYSSQGLSCSFRDLESVPTVSTPNALNATSDTWIEQAGSRTVAIAQCGSSESLAGPQASQASQADNSYLSTRLRSKEPSLQTPLKPILDFASPRMIVNSTRNEPLTRKHQRHEAKTTGSELEQPQPEQGAIYQQSEETNQCLREEIQRLRRENSDKQARQTALIKGFVASAAVVEVAVDIRGAELRSGLSSMGGTPEQMQEQAREMIKFSNATSRHVSMLVKDMLEEQGVYLNDSQLKTLRHEFESAQPNQAMRATLDEKLSFTMGRSGP